MRFRLSSVFFLAAGLACAQKASFDVASIKPSAPQELGRIMMRVGGDPGMIDYNHVNLRLLIQRAFGVKDYQIVAPDWANSEYFDVQAKLPPDTPQEKRNEMMRTLLEERFGLKYHKESKEVPVYSLIVGKNGPKLKEVEAPPQPKPGDNPRPGAMGMPKPDGAMPKAAPGMMMMRMEGMGRAHLAAGAQKMAGFADFLSRQVDRPVIDNTGLTGYYDIELEFKPEMGAGRGIMVGPPRQVDGGSGGPAPDQVEAPSVFTAIQDQLGLKLEPKKGPIETIVVDHLEKSPIEN